MLSTWSTSKSEPVSRKVRGRKEEEMVEKPSVIANCMKNMGFGGFSHQCIHCACGKLQEQQFQSNEPHKVQDPCWGFPSSWWCIHKRKNFHARQPAETERNAAHDYPTSREKTQRLHSVLQMKYARWKEGNNIHL